MICVQMYLQRSLLGPALSFLHPVGRNHGTEVATEELFLGVLQLLDSRNRIFSTDRELPSLPMWTTGIRDTHLNNMHG